MKKFDFAIFDPRASEANEKIFSSGPVYGIEVTVSALAARCVENLDPQHSGGDHDLAAIEAATTVELPPDGATLVTVRADLDAVGAMAVFSLRAEGMNVDWAKYRIQWIAESDKFARGGYPGPRPLPSKTNPWPEQGILAAIAAAISDFKVPLADRVQLLKGWLLNGIDPEQYRAQVEKERQEMIAALELGAIKFETRANGRVCVVESTHRASTSVGYANAPVVIALNPTFRQGPGEPYRKFTICQFSAGYVDIKAALADLSALETGWGGSPTIGGSPQGVSSTLTTEQVVEAVVAHLLK